MLPAGELPLQRNQTERESRQLQLKKERTPCQYYYWHICCLWVFKESRETKQLFQIKIKPHILEIQKTVEDIWQPLIQME